jgi:hypothetical protein
MTDLEFWKVYAAGFALGAAHGPSWWFYPGLFVWLLAFSRSHFMEGRSDE